MESVNKYWFYLEPYCFIFKTENEYVVYNTLNSSYLRVPEAPLISDIMSILDDASNGYCIVLDETQVAEPSFVKFVKQVKDTFSGGLVNANSENSKPFIFKPVLFLNTNIRKAKEKDFSFLGERILENLNEVSMYLPNACKENCEGCTSYYKQMLHCTCFSAENMSIANYLSLILDLNSSGVKKVNILGGDLLNNEYFLDLLPTLNGCNFKRVYHLYINNLEETYKELLNDDIELVVSIHSGFDKELVETWMNSFSSYNVLWKFVILSEVDILKMESLNVPSFVRMEVKPFYTGKNLSFFKENIFCSLEDIISEPISRKTIFRRQTLNEYFFGKLVFLPSGNVYANLNCRMIGKYPQSSLKKLVFEELTNSTAWFLLRDKQPCDKCLNKYLCPSVSDYELVIGKDNLCLLEE